MEVRFPRKSTPKTVLKSQGENATTMRGNSPVYVYLWAEGQSWKKVVVWMLYVYIHISIVICNSAIDYVGTCTYTYSQRLFFNKCEFKDQSYY